MPEKDKERSPSAQVRDRSRELPPDFDQYEAPYNYDNELPEDDEVKERQREQEVGE